LSFRRVLANDGAADRFAEKVRGKKTVDKVGVKELVVKVLGEQWGDLRDEPGSQLR
jgi:hypothetical protein